MESSPKLLRHIGSGSTWAEELYLHAPRDLLQRPPYACEFWCLVLCLSLWLDVAAELHAQGLLNVVLFLSSSP